MIPEQSLGLSLREEYGLTLRDLLNLHDWTKQALIFGGLMRTFTEAQIARFLWHGNLDAAREGLDRLLHVDGVFGVLEAFPLPNSLGGATTDVYYVNERGAEWFDEQCSRLLSRVRTSRPEGALARRIPHELLITEAFVRFWPEVDIQDFLPDEELRRRIIVERCRRTANKEPKLESEVMGDFVLVVPADPSNPAGAESWCEYEVALAYSARQIQEKPKGMFWITPRVTQADTIEQIVGRRPQIITTVTSIDPARDEASPELKTGFTPQNPLDQQVLSSLRTLGGAATAEGIAALTADDRANISRVLKRLMKQHVIAREYASFQRGHFPGRSLAVYALAGTPIATYEQRLAALIRSELAAYMREYGYGLSRLIHDAQAVIFVHSDPTRLSLLMFVDDGTLPPEALKTVITDALHEHSSPARAAFCAVANATRSALLTAAGLPVKLWDVLKTRQRRRADRKRGIASNVMSEA